MLGWYILSKNEKNQFWFVLKAANSQTILQSEMYTTKAAAQSGIASVQKNCTNDDRFERKIAKNEEHFFVLKAGNGEIIGKSETYTTKQSCENGIESVKKNGVTTTIKE